MGHIPPGKETYGYSQLWHSKYVRTYLDIVEDPVLGSNIALQLFGHVHAEEIRYLKNAPEEAGPMLISGAVSPVYENYPGFRILEYNRSSGRPLHFETYFTKLEENTSLSWNEGYVFPDVYFEKNDTSVDQPITNKLLKDLQEVLLFGNQDWNTYSQWYKTNYSNDLMEYGNDPLVENNLTETERALARRRYVCATTIYTTQEEFQECYNHTGENMDYSMNVTEQLHSYYQEGNLQDYYRLAHFESKIKLQQSANYK